MTCETASVYWQPTGSDPCDFCLEAEGYYASAADCPESHDRCQCALVDLDSLEVEFDEFDACVDEVEDFVWLGIEAPEEDTTVSVRGFAEGGDLGMSPIEEFDDDCFRDYCEETSPYWDPVPDLDDEITLPAGRMFLGGFVVVYQIVDYSAQAYFVEGEGEDASRTEVGIVTGHTQNLLRVEFDGDFYDPDEVGIH